MAVARRFELSPEQESMSRYLPQSHRFLPVRHADLQKMKVPLCVGVTPFPRDSPTPPCLPYDFRAAPHCQRCNAKATKRFCHCTDNRGWLCGICNFKNPYTEDRPLFQDTVQVQAPVWDAFAAPNVDRTRPIQVLPRCHLLVLELSDIARPIYELVIDSLVARLQDADAGFFSVFAFDRGLHIPLIAANRRHFSVATVADVESPLLPPNLRTFFRIPGERDLMIQYLETLKRLQLGMVLVQSFRSSRL
jgi:hypothetical protein